MSKILLVHVFGENLSFEAVDKKDDLDNLKYDYSVEESTLRDENANGTAILKFLDAKGELLPVSFGKWQLLPIVELPFNWQGTRCCMKVVDPFNITKEYEFCFDNRSIFGRGHDSRVDVKGVLLKMIEFENYFNHSHYELCREHEALSKKHEELKSNFERKTEEIKVLKEEIAKLKNN